MRQHIIERQRLLPAFEAALDSYDNPTAQHSVRVGRASAALGRALGLEEDDQVALAWAGALHDVGKLAVPEWILAKRGALDASDWRVIRRHPDVGADLLLAVSSELEPVAVAVRGHHEWWDGSGYPHGSAGGSIPILSRIVAVVDAFDSMISPRPYRKPIDATAALAELRRGAGTQFDPTVVDRFAELQAT